MDNDSTMNDPVIKLAIMQEWHFKACLQLEELPNHLCLTKSKHCRVDFSRLP